VTGTELETIADILHDGGIISYPTEAVFGLGCDPLNEKAVLSLLSIKKRPIEKGLILIASSIEQALPFITLPDDEIMEPVLASWPGPHTWLLPINKNTPRWLTGKHNKIAIRITDHAIAKAICESASMPIVSTSANITGQTPATDSNTVKNYFPTQLDYIVSGEIIGDNNPSIIKDALTGQTIRD